MSDFRKMRLTPDGRELLALAHQGTPLTFTAIVMGNGVWTEAQQADASVSALVNQKVSVTITKITQSGDSARLEALLTNTALAEGFSITEIGIIATHPIRGNILYMVDYCPPEKASYIQSKDGVPIEVPLAIDVLVASSQDVTLKIDDRFFGATKQDIADHNNKPDAHGVLVDTLRTHAPLVGIVGGADIAEGDTFQLLVLDWSTYQWVSEIKVKINDASGTDETAAWTVTPNMTTGRIDLTAPEVSADKTVYVYLQIWEHGLVRSKWTLPLTINVGDVPINRPIITAPANGAIGQGETPSITTSVFSADGAQTHADTQMQIATDTGFADIVRDTASLGAVTVFDMPPGILITGQVYYVRARHKGSDGNWSPWSPVSSFFTAASFIYVDRPVNTSPVSGAGEIGETPTLVASAFSTNGVGNFAHARFQVDVVGGDFSAPVHDSGVLGAVTEYTIPAGVLAVSTQYKWRTQYTDDSGVPVVSDWSSPTTFTTAAAFSAASKWAEWDETDEAGLTHPNVFVALFENPNAGGNEIGQGGGLDESVRTLTQVSNVDGAIGSPPSRQVDGGKQFSVKAGVLSLITANASRAWSFILRYDVSFPSSNNSNLGWVNSPDILRRLYTASGLDGSTERYMPSIKGSGGTASPAASPTGNGYWCWWCDGVNVYCGWCATKPTKRSDFTATMYVNATASGKAFPADFEGISLNDFPLPYGSSRNTSEKLRYLVVSRENLIDNNA